MLGFPGDVAGGGVCTRSGLLQGRGAAVVARKVGEVVQRSEALPEGLPGLPSLCGI